MKKKFAVWILLFMGMCFITACQSEKNGEPEARTKEERISYFPYQTMKELSDSSDMESIVRALPEIEPYLRFTGTALSEDRKVWTLKYDELYLKEWVEKLPDYQRADNPMYFSPYFHSRTLNNALLLLTIKEEVDTMQYEIRIPKEYLSNEEKEQKVYTVEYSRSEFNASLGNLNEVRENPDYYYTTLDYNNAIYSPRIFFNRVRLGSNEEWLLYRNGEPEQKLKEAEDEKPSVYVYGNTAFRFSPNVYGNDRSVIEIRVTPSAEDFGGGEMLPNIGLAPPENEWLKKERVLEYLGAPRMNYENTDYYRLNSGLSDYLYFTYNEKGEVVRYGVIRKGVRT